MAGVKVSELEYQGRLDGRHAWVHDEFWFYWTEKANVVTSDLAGLEPFCLLRLALVRGEQNSIRAFTKTDAKRGIIDMLNRK